MGEIEGELRGGTKGEVEEKSKGRLRRDFLKEG